MPKYDNIQIANELEAIALGHTYFGNALYVAMDFPWTTKNDRDMLARYLYGSELKTDRPRLQDFAILTRFAGEMPVKG
jgi:hypothetical protein